MPAGRDAAPEVPSVSTAERRKVGRPSQRAQPFKGRTTPDGRAQRNSEQPQQEQMRLPRSSSSKLIVPRIDGRGAAAGERQRQAKQALEEAIRDSKAAFERQKPRLAPAGGKTHRTIWADRQQQSQECTFWAATLHDAVNEGIDHCVPEPLLESAVQRILELEERAKEEEAAAQLVQEARMAIAAIPIKTPVTKQGSKAALRAAKASRLPLNEGSVVQLKGLADVSGITMGYIDVNLAKYDGRKGRVSKQPPPWVIKAVGAKAGEQAELAPRLEEVGGLVPILLESRSTDAHRHRGVWLAVPPANLKVISGA